MFVVLSGQNKYAPIFTSRLTKGFMYNQKELASRLVERYKSFPLVKNDSCCLLNSKTYNLDKALFK